MMDQMPVMPSATDPAFRSWLIREYGVLADVERGLGRPEREWHLRSQVARLRYGGTLDLSVLLEEASDVA